MRPLQWVVCFGKCQSSDKKKCFQAINSSVLNKINKRTWNPRLVHTIYTVDSTVYVINQKNKFHYIAEIYKGYSLCESIPTFVPNSNLRKNILYWQKCVKARWKIKYILSVYTKDIKITVERNEKSIKEHKYEWNIKCEPRVVGIFFIASCVNVYIFFASNIWIYSCI